MEVLTPQTLDEALALKAERKDAVPIQGGTDVMVELNFDRSRPETILNLNEVAELRGWGRDNGTLRLGSGLTYAEAVGNGVASVLPALGRGVADGGLAADPEPRHAGRKSGHRFARGRRLAAVARLRGGGGGRVGRTRGARGSGRALPHRPEAERALPDELIVAVRLEPREMRQTFMKVGPRNAMVIAVVSLCLAVDREADRFAFRTGRRARNRGSSELGLGMYGSLRIWSPAMRLRSMTYGERRHIESMR